MKKRYEMIEAQKAPSLKLRQTIKVNAMEKVINIHIEKLPEGFYLATSEDVPGLIAQGRTVIESLEIARDVARKLIEARTERAKDVTLSAVSDSFDYPLIVNS